MGHRQKKIYPADLLLLWPGEVRRKREDDSSRTGLALLAGTNKSELGRFFSLQMPHTCTFGNFKGAGDTRGKLYLIAGSIIWTCPFCVLRSRNLAEVTKQWGIGRKKIYPADLLAW